MSQIKTFMEEQAQILDREIKHHRKQLNILPKGTLAIKHRASGDYLYHLFKDRFGENKEKVLNERFRNRAERLQTRVIMEEQIKLMENSLARIQTFLNHYRCCDLETARTKVKSIYRDPLVYQGFLPQQSSSENDHEGYSNRFHADELIHKNSIGESFRSKGEVQVSELLLNRKIKYVYEPRLELPDRIVYPDFKVMLPGADQPKYIEYCGMLEEDKYLTRTMYKLRSYLQGGYKPGRDILFFFEDGDNGMDVQIMKRDLDNFLKLAH